MKSLILYSALIKLSTDHHPLETPHGKPIYIRMEEVPMGIAEALDTARPLEGETVLNTIPSPNQ